YYELGGSMSKIQQVIFDDTILYDKESAKIINLLNTNEVATLTVPANECLSIVLKNSPEVTTQKQLFHEVWEAHGIPINSNTFYQNISIIRKAFKQLGYTPDVLITIPRRGIVISKNIDIKKVKNHHLSEKKPLAVIEKPLTVIEQPLVKKNTTKKNKYHVNLSVVFLILLCLVMVFLYYNNMSKIVSPFSSYKYMGNYNDCSIYASESYSKNFLDNILKTIGGVACYNNEKLYVSVYSNLPRISVIKCNEYIYLSESICSSYYYYLKDNLK
ncbi:winged helix-turn-helix domain-containing protein, partial [Providencia rettgeri]